MRRVLVILFFGGCLSGGVVHGDIFEPERPSDTGLRDFLANDRSAFYMQTPGEDRLAHEAVVSPAKSLQTGRVVHASDLHNVERSFDLFLKEQLRNDRNYQSLVANIKPSLLLLEYASPAMADVVKHYRMSAYERLKIEEMRLGGIERSVEGQAERLARHSQLACLKEYQQEGLVAAMRKCQKAQEAFGSLVSVDGDVSLGDGRRRIHVVAQALFRLGFEKSRIEKIVALTGERIISDDGIEEKFPAGTFARQVSSQRQLLLRQWHAAWEKFAASRRVTAAKLQELSWAGAPVTARVFEDLWMLDADRRELFFLKLSSALAWLQVRQRYEQAAGYLDLCARDPRENEEFRLILLEKRDFLLRVMMRPGQQEPVPYKDLLAALSSAADEGRQQAHRASFTGPARIERKDFLLNF